VLWWVIYVIAVYVNYWSWHVHGSHSVYLQNRVWQCGGPPRPTSDEAEIGQLRSTIGKTEHGNRCLTSGRSSGWPGVASGGLDDWHDGRGSPARLSGVSRARERARLCEMGRGSECGHGHCSERSWGAWAGDVAGDLGVRASPRRAWGRRSWQGGPTSQRERERARGGRQLAPTALPHWVERGRERARTGKGTIADGWNPPVRRRGRAGAQPGSATLAFSFFLEFLFTFPFLFL
jgi:hypothetical protein